MIAYKYRFHGHSSLDYVYRNGQSFRSRLVNIKVIENKKRKDSRIAVVVGKKVIKSAVKRNLMRRRVYEYIRPRILSIKTAHDIVIIVTSVELLSASPAEMTAQLDQVFSQTKIFN